MLGTKRHAGAFAASIFCLFGYAIARDPGVAPNERARLAERFRLTKVVLPDPNGGEGKTVRQVHPKLEHISAWISSVGSAVALADIDGDGVDNEYCLVDPRFDTVQLGAVPETARARPFAPELLDPRPLDYDAENMAPMGCLPGDFDEDGRLDLLVYYWGRAPVLFMASEGGHRPRELIGDKQRWFTNAATSADLDGDGHLDLLVTNYFRDGARILDAKPPAGDPEDALTEMQDSMSRAFNGGGKHFFLWQKGQLSEVAVDLPEEIGHGWTLAAGAADLDGDLLPEIYLANDFGPDRLLHNRSEPGKLRFVELQGIRTLKQPASRVLGHDSHKGMGVDFGDLNGDGRLDIYVSNITEPYALLESNFAWISTGRVEDMKNGIAPYVDRSEQLGLARGGWGWESRLVDLDNDGTLEALQATGFVRGTIDRWPELQELAMGNDGLLRHPGAWMRVQPGDDLSGHDRNTFFVRGEGDRYVDVAREVGFGDPHVSRGIAIADVDADGDLDLALSNQWEPSYFYRNELCPDRCAASLSLRLVHAAGASGTRPAIGAVATVTTAGGRLLIAQVDGGSGHSGKRGHEVHFGLGNADRSTPVKVEVKWRDANGLQQSTFDLAPGRHTLVLGKGQS